MQRVQSVPETAGHHAEPDAHHGENGTLSRAGIFLGCQLTVTNALTKDACAIDEVSQQVHFGINENGLRIPGVRHADASYSQRNFSRCDTLT